MIKRGVAGVFGTDKTCAQETVECMIEDFHAGKLFFREISTRGELSGFIRARQPRVVTYEDWKK